jgi:hypothetical protein
MAWIEKQKRGGWLVRWREEGKTVSRYFSDQHEARNFASSQTRDAVYEKAGWTVMKYPFSTGRRHRFAKREVIWYGETWGNRSLHPVGTHRGAGHDGAW